MRNTKPSSEFSPARLTMLIGALLLLGASDCGLPKSVETREPLVRPEYELSLTPDLDLMTFDANCRIRFPSPEETLEEIPLHLYAAAVSKAEDGPRVIAVRSATINGQDAEFTVDGVLLTVRPPAPVSGEVEVTIDFEGVLPRMEPGESGLMGQSLEQLGQILGGMFGGKTPPPEADFGLLTYGDGILSFGNWYPQLPAFQQGGWQLADSSPVGDFGFSDIADYRLSVNLPPGAVVAATGILESSVETDGLITHRFEAPLARNVAVEISRHFEVASAVQDDIAINSYFLPEHRDRGQVVLDTAVDALQFYRDVYGPYPWKELDVVEAPLKGGAGGVEFTGLVTCSTGLYEDLTSDLGPLMALVGMGELGDLLTGIDEMLEFVVAHEVAHQWWNASVGSDSRREPFLDEALANFSAVRYFAHRHGAEAAARQRQLQLEINYQTYRFLGGPDLPVASPAGDFENILAYSAIVYGKGALFFEHLVDRFGEERVFRALSQYYEKGQLGVMASEDLEAALATIDDEVPVLWTRWIDETHGDEDIGSGILGELTGGLDAGGLLQELLGGDGLGALGGLEGLLGGSLDEALGEVLGLSEPAPR